MKNRWYYNLWTLSALNAKTQVFNVKDFRNITIWSFVSWTAWMTIKFFGWVWEDKIDNTIVASATNKYKEVSFYNSTTWVNTSWATWFVCSAGWSDWVNLFEINTDWLDWIFIQITAYTAWSVNLEWFLYDNL